MATQYSDKLRLALPVQGELSGAWGDVVNQEITSLIEQAIAGRAVIDSWTTNSHTLTATNGAPDEARAMMLKLTDTGGSLTGAGTLICPAVSKVYFVENDTGEAVTVKTAAGAGVLVETGSAKIVFCDGTDVQFAVTIDAGDVSGLGNAATRNVGTTAGTVAAGDDSRIVGAAQKSANLSDLTNASTARSNLGLGTAATANVTTSATDTTADRLLKVGDFGVGRNDINITDANNLSFSGFANFNHTTAANVPSGWIGHIISLEDNNAASSQILTDRTAGKIAFRTSSGGIYKPWQELYHTGNTGSAVTYDVTTSATDTTANRLLKVGDFGVGGTVNVNWPSASIDDASVGSGAYRVVDASTGGVNPPFTTGDYVLHQCGHYNAAEVPQLAFDLVSGNKISAAMRWVSATPSDWATFWTSSNLPSPAVKDSDNGFTASQTINSTEPTFSFVESDTNTTARILLASSSLYFQCGAAGQGSAASSGNLLFSGRGVTDVNLFQVRKNNAWQNILHTGNTGSSVTYDVTTSATDTTANRLLKVGDFGVGGLGISESDFNTGLLPSGFYSGAGISSINYPPYWSTYWGWVQLTRQSNSNNQARFQVYEMGGSTRAAIAQSLDGGNTWSSAELWSTDNLVKTTSPTDTTFGRMLQVGDGGINKASNQSGNLVNGNDFNLATSGLSRSADSGTLNTPNGTGYWTLLSAQYSGSTTAQLAMGIGGNDIYFRGNPGGGFSAWREIWHSGNLPVTVDGSNNITMKGFTFREWNTGNPDIDNLIGGSTFGSIIEGPSNGHFVIGIQGNDNSDGFYIIDNNNVAEPTTYSQQVLGVTNSFFRYKGNDVYHTGSPNVNNRRLSSNATLSRQGISTQDNVHWVTGATGTLTINTSTYVENDTIIIRKQATAGALTVALSGAGTFKYPDGTTDTSLTVPAGTAMTFSLILDAATTWLVSVQG